MQMGHVESTMQAWWLSVPLVKTTMCTTYAEAILDMDFVGLEFMKSFAVTILNGYWLTA